MKQLNTYIFEKILINKDTKVAKYVQSKKHILYLPFKVCIMNKDIDIYDYKEEFNIEDLEKLYRFYDKNHKEIFNLTGAGLNLFVDWHQNMMSDTCYGYKPVYLTNDCDIKKI